MSQNQECSGGQQEGGCGGCCGDGEKSGACLFEVISRVDYAPNSIVSSTVADNDAGTMTVFAFDTGQRLSTHSAPYDAHAYVLDGEALITVDNEPYTVAAGQMIVMPANVPHSVEAARRFKMLLVMFWAEA